MSTRILLAIGLALTSMSMLTGEMRGQAAKVHARKILKREKPEYPTVLKYKGIGGVVRLKVRVLANGNVESFTIGGGNPILAESAAKAIMAWKFAPASAATYEVVTFDFNH